MSHDDRPKKTFAELDRMRREGRRDEAPRGHHARVRQEKARRDALSEADSLFAQDLGGSEGDRIAKQIRDAHGTPGLADACREYCDVVGAMPKSPELLALFLDSGDETLVVQALEALLSQCEAGTLDPTRSLKSRVRVLAQDFNSAIAEVAEELQDSF